MKLNPIQTVCLWAYRILPAVALIVLLVLMLGILRDAAALGSGAPAPGQPSSQSAVPGQAVTQTAPVGQGATNSPPNPGQTTSAQTAAEAEKLKEFKEEVKLYLEWIIAIAGIFTIAQTIAAGYTAQAFSDQAEKSIKGIDDLKTSTATDIGTLKTNTTTDLTTLKTNTTTDLKTLSDNTGKDLERFKAKYQNVVLAEEAREVAIGELRKTYQSVAARAGSASGSSTNATLPVGWLDWRLDLFGTMDVIRRQRLLSIDRYLGFDLQLESMEEKVDRENTIRLLANFYVGKFDYDAARQTANWMDLERAEYLLRLGIRHLDAPFWLHNDLGLVLVKYADRYRALGQAEESRRVREQARRVYEEASRMEPKQQRSYYNLGRIAKDLGEASKESLKEAIRLSEKARPLANWEINPDPSMQPDLLYNLACYQALLAYAEVKDRADIAGIPATDAEPVLKLLEELAQEGRIRKKVVEDDLAPGGDFFGFQSRLAPAEKARLIAVLPKLSAHEPPGFAF